MGMNAKTLGLVFAMLTGGAGISQAQEAPLQADTVATEQTIPRPMIGDYEVVNLNRISNGKTLNGNTYHDGTRIALLDLGKKKAMFADEDDMNDFTSSDVFKNIVTEQITLENVEDKTAMPPEEFKNGKLVIQIMLEPNGRFTYGVLNAAKIDYGAPQTAPAKPSSGGPNGP